MSNEGKRVRMNYGEYDYTGHLNRWQKLWANRKERKWPKREAIQESGSVRLFSYEKDNER